MVATAACRLFCMVVMLLCLAGAAAAADHGAVWAVAVAAYVGGWMGRAILD